MIQVTPEATKHLLRVRRERGFDALSGARLIRNAGRVGLTFTAGPEPGDRRVDGNEIALFVAPDVATLIDESVIDAQLEEGKVSLVIRRRKGSKPTGATTPAS